MTYTQFMNHMMQITKQEEIIINAVGIGNNGDFKSTKSREEVLHWKI